MQPNARFLSASVTVGPAFFKIGMLTIFVLAILPLPLFDIAGMAAGVLKMPLPKFLIATLGGKLIKMWLAAYMGAGAFIWLEQFFK